MDGMNALGGGGTPDPNGLTDEQRQILQRLKITPEQFRAIMESGVFGPRSQLNQQQMTMADALRNSPMPEGQMVSGRYVAANPLQMAGSLISRLRGSRQMDKLIEERTKLINGLGKGRGFGSLAAAGDQLGPEEQMPQPVTAPWDAEAEANLIPALLRRPRY